MKHLFVLTILVTGTAWSQTQPVLKARELFYTPPPDAAKPAVAAKAARGESRA